MTKRPENQTLELELRTVLAHDLFPGRSALRIAEIAAAWECTIQHVLDLIEEAELVAFDIRGKVRGEAEDGTGVRPSQLGNSTARRCLRVPVSAYDAFLRRRSNLPTPPSDPRS